MATRDMTPAQYRDAIAALGLSQVAAGQFLTNNPRTSRRWASGESRVPKAVAMLLWLMLDLRGAGIYLKPEDIEATTYGVDE